MLKKILVRAGGVHQMLECLLSKCKALSSNPNTSRSKGRKEGRKD
jgi:hypothetical protein